MHVPGRIVGTTVLGLCLIPMVMGQEPAPSGAAAQPRAQRPPAKAQPRPNGQRVKVDPALVVVEDGDTVWSEWEHRGTRPDGSAHVMRGVVIFGVEGGLASWARFYLEPVQDHSGGVDEAVEQDKRLASGGK